MKKWRLHTIACICNAIAVTAVLPIIIYNIITTADTFSFMDGFVIVINLIIYTVYISGDMLGMKLYNYLKNADLVSPIPTLENKIALFSLLVVQIFTGILAYPSIKQYVLHFSYTIENFLEYGNIVGTLILVIFITGLIVFFGCVLLFRKLKNNNEIENIGNPELQNQV